MAASQPINKQTAYWGVSWEEAYGYPQARRVGNEIYVSGQFNHDEAGNLLAPAPLSGSWKTTLALTTPGSAFNRSVSWW